MLESKARGEEAVFKHWQKWLIFKILLKRFRHIRGIQNLNIYIKSQLFSQGGKAVLFDRYLIYEKNSVFNTCNKIRALFFNFWSFMSLACVARTLNIRPLEDKLLFN